MSATSSSPIETRTTSGPAPAAVFWTQVETGSAITWKYPSVILKGDNSVGEFYSIVLLVFLPMWIILVPVSACWRWAESATE